jgi:hypothetical protein
MCEPEELQCAGGVARSFQHDCESMQPSYMRGSVRPVSNANLQFVQLLKVRFTSRPENLFEVVDTSN